MSHVPIYLMWCVGVWEQEVFVGKKSLENIVLKWKEVLATAPPLGHKEVRPHHTHIADGVNEGHGVWNRGDVLCKGRALCPS